MSYDLNEVKSQVENGQAKLLDVREQEEWNEGHLTHSVLVPLSELDGGRLPDNLSKEEVIYTHCKMGQRSMMAADILRSRGYQQVTSLNEGFDDLVSQGFSCAVS